MYNADVWSDTNRQMYTRLNSVCMRGLRRVANQCRYSATSSRMTDHEVQRELGAPSLQCLLSQRRLKLLATLLRHAPVQLCNLLASRVHSVALSCVQQLIADLQRLRDFHAPKLDELGDVMSCATTWSSFILNYPAAWSILVKQMSVTSMGLDRRITKAPCSINGATDRFACSLCSDCAFVSYKALQSHMRSKHDHRNVLSQYLDSSLKCPVCCVQFGNFPRLLGHVSDTRRRGSRPLSCNQVLKAGLIQAVPVAAQEAAQRQARQERAEGRKLGQTNPRVLVPAKRPRIGTIVPSDFSRDASSPMNAFDWQMVRPAKRLRCKTSLDAILSLQLVASD